ncbi:MAG: hypothetical protein ACI8Q9_000543 [Planctomycetota bacterium]|jgi:hypothetical protein
MIALRLTSMVALIAFSATSGKAPQPEALSKKRLDDWVKAGLP